MLRIYRAAHARYRPHATHTEISKGAFYHARVCSDADLLDTVLNMLERMQTTAGQQPMGRCGETVGNVRADAGVCIAHNHISIVMLYDRFTSPAAGSDALYAPGPGTFSDCRAGFSAANRFAVPVVPRPSSDAICHKIEMSAF